MSQLQAVSTINKVPSLHGRTLSFNGGDGLNLVLKFIAASTGSSKPNASSRRNGEQQLLRDDRVKQGLTDGESWWKRLSGPEHWQRVKLGMSSTVMERTL